MLKKRVISASVLLPIVVGLIALGAWPYWLLVAVVTGVAGFEYTRMFRKKGYDLSIPLTILTILIWEANAIWPDVSWLPTGVTVATLIIMLSEVVRLRQSPQRPNPTEQWALTLAGASYLGIGGAYLMLLRARPDGFWWTITTLIIVWISDSAAYFVGKRWGTHKIAPNISPGKSWEGYGAQVVSGFASGLLMGWLWPALSSASLSLNAWRGLILGGVVSALCPVGDFFVSMMKREVDVKDTSNLIPGHGGVFDRIDTVLWAVVLAHIVTEFLFS
ncbi:MAG: phosphatidate cytidylyltransferase [Anaerolineae bacterium]